MILINKIIEIFGSLHRACNEVPLNAEKVSEIVLDITTVLENTNDRLTKLEDQLADANKVIMAISAFKVTGTNGLSEAMRAAKEYQAKYREGK